MPRPSDPAWRKGGKPGTKKQESLKPWQRQKEKSGEETHDGGRRIVRIGVGVAGIMAALAGLIWLILLLRQVPATQVLLVGAGYETNLILPHNAYGWAGLNSLFSWLEERRQQKESWDSHKLAEPALLRLNQQSVNTWADSINNSAKSAVVIYFACHGGADSQGAYLFLDDAPYDYTKGILRVQTILSTLQGLPEDKPKLVIFDATQIDWHLPSGMLHNNFVANVRKEVESSGVKNLCVLCSSSEDQRSWVYPGWRQTVFTHFLIEGLSGEANRLPYGSGNERLTVAELANYLTKRVNDCVKVMADKAVQKPVLLPETGQERIKQTELLMVRDVRSKRPQIGSVDLDGLKKLWEEREALASQVPAPFVYRPHIWHQYQDSLLRYEQLLIAGSDLAGEMRSRLEQLKQRLGLPQQSQQSLTASLAMPAALGRVIAVDPELKEIVKQYWKDPEKGVKLLLNEQKANEDLARLALARHLLDRVIESKKSNEEVLRAAKWLELSRTSTSLRPTEAHLLYMLAYLYRDVMEKDGLNASLPDSNLVQQTFAVARLAEQAALADSKESSHPYSEIVFPRIQGVIERADAERRQAEDLLFAASNQWDAATDHLKKAREEYEVAGKTGRVVQEGIALRDQVLSDFPYYGAWLALQRDTDSDRWRTDFEELARETESLVKILAEPAASADLERLSSRTKSVKERFAALEQRFRDRCQAASTATQTDRYLVQTALSIPLVPSGDRVKLIRINDENDAKFDESAQRHEDNRVSEADAANEAWRAGERQARMSLALVSDEWLSEAANARRNDFLRDWLDRPEQQDWQAGLSLAGEKLRLCWQKIPRTIGELTAAVQGKGTKESVSELQKADLLARLADGAAASELKADPVLEYRAVGLHELLCWEAGRAYHDHWFDENGAAYYARAVSAFLSDAKELVAGNDWNLNDDGQKKRLEEDQGLESKLTRPLQVAFQGPGKLDVTTERLLEFQYQITAPPDLLPGYPVLWRLTGAKFTPKGWSAKDRVVVTNLNDKGESQQRFTVENNSLAVVENRPLETPKHENTEVELKGVFRGQIVSSRTPVVVHRGADVTMYEYPKPQKATLAVRADDDVKTRFAPTAGTIAIVVDFSGSMKERPSGKDRKIDEALSALENVLGNLPPGAMLSLWAFGQVPNRSFERQEDTIEQIRPPQEWSPSQLADLMARLRSLKPEYATPLLRTMLDAASKDLLARKREGLKTLLVLTDGEDTCFLKGRRQGIDSEGDPVYNAGHRSDPKFMTETLESYFKNADIEINMIFFGVPTEEEWKSASQQFEVIKSFKVLGHLVPAKNANELRDHLRNGLTQELRCRLFSESQSIFVDPQNGKLVTNSTRRENPQWFPPLDSGLYKAYVHTFAQEVLLEKGDALMATLTNGGYLRRDIIGEEYQQYAPPTKTNGWQVSVLEDRHTTTSAPLKVTVALEETEHRNAPNQILSQIRPTFAWFELSPQDVHKEVAVRFGALPGYPAPMYHIDAGTWPSHPNQTDPDAVPVLQAWWIAKGLPGHEESFSISDLVSDSSEKRKRRVTGGDVEVESVQIDSWHVRTAEETKADKPCLIVRLRFPADKPYVVHLSGAEPVGQEHRIYRTANRYTGIFWPMTQKDMEGRTLDLIAIDTLKKDAEKRGGTTGKLRLEAPTQGGRQVMEAPLGTDKN
jgi:hypothetical protein